MDIPGEKSRSILAGFGLPPGLLPANVKSIEMDPARGNFQVELTAEVQREVAGIPVKFERKVSGVLATGHIRALKGVKAKMVLWLPVTGIRAEGSDLAFEVGPAARRLPTSTFV